MNVRTQVFDMLFLFTFLIFELLFHTELILMHKQKLWIRKAFFCKMPCSPAVDKQKDTCVDNVKGVMLFLNYLYDVQGNSTILWHYSIS